MGLVECSFAGVDPQVGPAALDGPIEEGLHPRVKPEGRLLPSISSTSRDALLFDMQFIPMALTRSSTERVEMPWTLGSSPRTGSGSPDHRRQRLLGHAARLQGERSEREVGTILELRNAQFHRAGPFGGKSWVLP